VIGRVWGAAAWMVSEEALPRNWKGGGKAWYRSMGQYEVACLDRPERREGSESGAAPALRIEHGRLIAF
jgi:hypothetical protein